VKPPRNVDYVVPCIYRLDRAGMDESESTYFVEPRLAGGGGFERYTNNFGGVDTKTSTSTLLAFTHWTWHKAKQRMMVTDLQVRKKPLSTLMLECDIHCTPLINLITVNRVSQPCYPILNYIPPYQAVRLQLVNLVKVIVVDKAIKNSLRFGFTFFACCPFHLHHS
jgi:hypothetical protein